MTKLYNPIIGTNKTKNGDEVFVYEYPSKIGSPRYPFFDGICRRCGAKLKVSQQGKEYCEKICWTKPDEILVRDILFYNPKADLRGVDSTIAKQMLAKLKNKMI